MRQTKLFARTKKEEIKEAIIPSHRYLIKADFIDQLSSGIYSFLPLGWRVHRKIEKIIRIEMQKIGAQEVFLPALQPRKLWEETKRWETIDPPLFKLKDRHQKEFGLGSTHEEVISYLARTRIQSYKDLPLALFQIQTKFRNELRFTGGLLRTREFLMKDLYSFHATADDFKKYYENLKKVYLRIFKKMGLLPIITEASGAGFTKERTHEFQVMSPSGEDTIIFCPRKHFSQNKEIAKVKEGDKCPICKNPLKRARAIEVGNIFPLGTKYSEDMGVYFSDNRGNRKPVIMGCYGIGLGRLMGTIIEVHHDEKGMIWPKEVAPFFCHLIPVENNQLVKKTTEKLYRDFKNSGIDVLYDDRQDRTPGEKFATSDLIGIPYRLVISKKTLKSNSVEFKEREKEKIKLIKIKELINFFKKSLK